MKAFVTSIGETTTDLCVWSLERLGFEVTLFRNPDTSLWQKLHRIYEVAQDDFIRVDADVVVNKNVLEMLEQKDLWWYQSLTFGWFKQDVIHGGVQLIRKPALEHLRSYSLMAQHQERPETYLSRIDPFFNPRRFGTFEKICGIHGFKQNDVQRVKDTKERRGRYEEYDWELAESLDTL